MRIRVSLAMLLGGLIFLAIGTRTAVAQVQILTQSATISARASYSCSETDTDVDEADADFTDTSALNENLAASIVGSCGSASGQAQLQSAITADQISSSGTCGAGGSGEAWLPGGFGGTGSGRLFYEVTFRLTDPTPCSYFAESSVGGQGESGGSIHLSFFSSDGTVYFDDSWFDIFVPDVLLPPGDYTLRATGAYGATDGGGAANHQLAVTFEDPVVIPTQSLSLGALKGRF
jgi:hypothetical protein